MVIQQWRHAKNGEGVSKYVTMSESFLMGGGSILVSVIYKIREY